MRVIPVTILADNYGYLLVDDARRVATVVDPGNAEPILRALARDGLALEGILATHHHGDHVGGIPGLLAAFPGVPVRGSRQDARRIPGLTHPLGDGDALEAGGARGVVLATPGHTRGSLCFHLSGDMPGDVSGDPAGDLFTGDTLFGGTMGNLFEGTPDEMLAGLLRIRALPPATRLWPGHDYTRMGLREALRLLPGSAAIRERLARFESDRAAGRPPLPLLLADELATNPYLQWDSPELRAALGTDDDAGTFRRLCEVT